MQKYLLSINNYLYYVTRAADDEEFKSEKVIGFYNLLKNYINKKNLWQDRFYDTLGWYNFRLAVINEDNKSAYKLLLDEAWDFNQNALAGIRTPREERVYNKLKSFIRQRKIDMETETNCPG